MTTALDTLASLGVVGVVLALASVITAGYWTTRPFRPDATWFADLATCRRLLSRPARTPKRSDPMGPGLWPRAEVGPRMWRWPLNSTRWFCGRLWRIVVYRRGLVGFIGRAAWYPTAGIGAVAAMTQALILMTAITLPIATVLLVVDSATVLRGGMPPTKPVHARKIEQAHRRRTHHATQRLAAIRADLDHTQNRPARHRPDSAWRY